MRGPRVLIFAPNAFASPGSTSYEVEFRLRTRSGHLASFSNLVRLFNPIGDKPPELDNSWREARSMAGYYLESFLKVRGYEARTVFDLERDGRAAVAGETPLALVLSTTYITTVDGLATMVRDIRSLAGDDVPLVVGGPYVWKQALASGTEREDLDSDPSSERLFAERTDPDLRSVIYVAHEFGEHTLLRLLEALARGDRSPEDLRDVPNLALPVDGTGWHFTEAQPEPVDLDRDYTRWDLVDDFPSGAVPLRSSVGCPYRCEFCDFVVLHPKVLLRSPASIVEELDLVARRGARFVNFVDDNAFTSKARIADLAGAMIESELGLRWGGFLRADRVTDENVGLLARAGLRYAWCGIESGDPEMLRRMNKRCDLEAARQGIDRLTSSNVNVLTTFVVGFPGETMESIDRSVEFLNSLNREARGRVEYILFPFVLFPDAPINNSERRSSLALSGSLSEWRHETMTSSQLRSTVAPQAFKDVELGYNYYGADDSLLWTVVQRNAVIKARKALTIAFLDHQDDLEVQRRCDALRRLLTSRVLVISPWRGILAARRQQPGGVE